MIWMLRHPATHRQNWLLEVGKSYSPYSIFVPVWQLYLILEQLEAISLSELEAPAHKGDLSARVVLGRKRIEMKDHIAGRSDLMGALLDGSTHAAIEMARSNTPDIPRSSLSEARAYYRFAYLLGGWKAPREAYISQQKYGGFDSWEMARSDERAMELYRNILKYRGGNHIPLRVWPRP
ncbi:hypothetical protein [Thermomonas brevis]